MDAILADLPQMAPIKVRALVGDIVESRPAMRAIAAMMVKRHGLRKVEVMRDLLAYSHGHKAA